MITKQEQEILDNAPDGAEYYRKADTTRYASYLNADKTKIYVVNGSHERWEFMGAIYTYEFIALADLREKQGKTVVDAVNIAVNILRANLRNLHNGEHGDIERFELLIERVGLLYGIHGYDLVCTTEEFNQCVKEMSYHAGMTKFNNYLANNSPLEPVKPDVEAEYVKCDDFTFDLKSDFDNGNLYAKYDGDYKIINVEDDVCYHSYDDTLYRKVETETTWQDDLKELIKNSETISERHELGGFAHFASDSVECAEFIEIIRRLASSMSK